MPSKKEEEFVRKEAIRTMKGDIARLKSKLVGRGVVSKKEAVELKLEEEQKRKEEEEKRKRAEEERKRKEEERLKKEEEEEKKRREEQRGEEQREEEAEKARIEEEKKRKIREEKRRKEEEERRRREEEQKRTEEEQRKIEEERRKKENERLRVLEAAEERKRREEEGKRETEEEQKRKEEEEKRKRAEEERKRKEEERLKKEEPKIRKKELLGEKEKIEEKKIKLEESFEKLAIEKSPLDLQKATLLKKLEEVEENFQAISTKEKKVEETQRLIEEKEEKAKTPEERRRIEKERWRIEEKRRDLEKKRWPWGEKLKQLDEQIREIELGGGKIEARGKELIEKQKEISEKEEQIQIAIEKIELKEELQEVEQLKESLGEKQIGCSGKLNKIEESLSKVSARERKIEEEKKLIEEEERATKELKERRELEKERWGIEEKRREVEAERWELEEEKNRIEAQLKRFEGGIQTFSEKRNNIIKRIKEIGVKLGTREEIEAEKPPPAPVIAGKKVIEGREEKLEKVAEERAKEIKREPTIAPSLPGRTPAAKVSPEAPSVSEEQGKAEEIGKRRIEEARKRIEVLKKEVGTRRKEEEQEETGEERRKKEKEEQKRREEVKKITIQEKRRRELLERLQGVKKEPKKPSFLPKLPEIIKVVSKKPPTFSEKLWIRILIVSILLVLLAGVSTFWYWFLVIRKQPPVVECVTDGDCPANQICASEGICVEVPPLTKCITDDDCPAEQICNPEGLCVKKEPEITIPLALFLVDDTRSLTISSAEELRSLLPDVLQEWQDEDQFTRLIIKDEKENKLLGLKEFFEALLIRAPEGFYQKIDNDFTLFIYSQRHGNRLGFVAKIENYEGLTNLLRDQEPTMEDDYQTFFALMGKEGAAIIPYFRNAENVQGYTGPNFRYQTLTREDLGILYLTSGNYFVFASSWISMEKIIERLGLTGDRIELTIDLKRGDRGYEVELLQTWLAQDATVYPQAIANGFFGPLTEAAVIRLQEKYASEILAPQGLSKGDGIVNSYVRIKLNELYGDSGVKPRMVELTTDLRIGDYGEEVKLLQTWLAKDRKIYPRGITSGYFGYLTQQAVTRFQERYSSEILTSQGLTRGTGIVDALTRGKLNELYGE